MPGHVGCGRQPGTDGTFTWPFHFFPLSLFTLPFAPCTWPFSTQHKGGETAKRRTGETAKRRNGLLRSPGAPVPRSPVLHRSLPAGCARAEASLSEDWDGRTSRLSMRWHKFQMRTRHPIERTKASTSFPPFSFRVPTGCRSRRRGVWLLPLSLPIHDRPCLSVFGPP